MRGGAAVVVAASVALAVVVVVGFVVADGDGGGAPGPRRTQTTESPGAPIDASAYLRDACELPAKWVTRINRGWRRGPARDFDLILVPQPYNYVGTETNTSHSGPYDFLQRVPLVFYGPGFIQAAGDVSLDREVTVADIAPTVAALMDFEFATEDAQPITEIFTETDAAPRLIFTLSLDGAGWNALNEWPEAWPTLARLMEEGASLQGATVGSSPSITPATHTNMSTGTWPRYHAVTGIAIHRNDGSVGGAFTERSSDSGVGVDPNITLLAPTIADLWDRARGNEPLVGYVANGNYSMGLIGQGADFEGGDKDLLAMVEVGEWATNPEFFYMPDYVNTQVPGPERDLEEVDLRDGKNDDLWRGHEIRPLDATPAFAAWEERTVSALLEREGFGDDELTDLFYLNIKTPDAAGHHWNMIAPEQADALESADQAIARLLDTFEEVVGRDNYVLIVTADHGQTPLGHGGFAISRGEMLQDISRRFDTLDNGQGLIQQTSATSLFANKKEMNEVGVRPEQVASFLSRYTIGDNIAADREVPPEYEDRLEERIFSAVVPGRELEKVVRCTGAEA